MNELKLKWLTKAEAYSDLYDELKQGEYTDVEVRLMLISKISALTDMVKELDK